MTIGSADLHKGIMLRWKVSGLDWEFKKLWTESDRTRFSARYDGQAAPGTPFPYCVYEGEAGDVVERMSGGTKRKHHTRDVPWIFRVHAKERSGDGRSAKQIASDLADLIVSVYGGHPDQSPDNVPLDNGSVLLMQYQTDYGVLTGQDTYQWIINYTARLDVPVMTG